MEHTGRQSAADLSVVRVTASDRPQPPDHLSPWQADLWRSVTATKPAEWFTDDTLPLLEAYVDAALAERNSAEAMRAYTGEMLADPDHLAQYDKATKIFARVAGVVAQMAIKMRLSQSARYGARGASGAHERTAKSAKPWDN